MKRIIGRFIRRVRDTSLELSPKRIVDLGCGEGLVAQVLHEALTEVEYLGIDVSASAVEMARSLNPQFTFQVGSILDEVSRPGWADLVLCLEVVEHLEDPDQALERIVEWTSGHALVSVPWEPWFRLGNLLRGRHISRLGNHPEHLQQYSPRSFRHLFHRHGVHANVSTCFPWIIARASRR